MESVSRSWILTRWRGFPISTIHILRKQLVGFGTRVFVHERLGKCSSIRRRTAAILAWGCAAAMHRSDAMQLSSGAGAAVSRARRSSKRRSENEIADWYAGKSFTADWTMWKIPIWMKLLAPYQSRRTRVLEIGSWEGRSALFFLNYLRRARLTCID